MLRAWLTGVLFDLAVAIGVVVAVVHAQEVWQIEQRLNDMDKDLSGRVRVLESDMIEIKWMARGLALAILGQLVLATFNLRELKHEHRSLRGRD